MKRAHDTKLTLAVMKPRTSNVLEKIAARAKRGDVEVEHLLLLARLADPSAVPALRELSATHAWPMMKRGFVPLGMWVECIATYLTRGAGAVARGVKDAKLDGAVALGLIEESSDAASMEACIAIGRDPPSPRFATGFASRALHSWLLQCRQWTRPNASAGEKRRGPRACSEAKACWTTWSATRSKSGSACRRSRGSR